MTREVLESTSRPELYYPKALHSARERTVKPLVFKLHPSDNVAVAPRRVLGLQKQDAETYGIGCRSLKISVVARRHLTIHCSNSFSQIG